MKTSLLLLAVISVAALTLPFRTTKIQAAEVSSAAKHAASFSFLRAHRQGKGVTVTWKTKAIDKVLDFVIQRTYEDPGNANAYWENIATIPSSSVQSFTYTDREVFPGTIYYRIVALLIDGTTVQSEISSLQIVNQQE